MLLEWNAETREEREQRIDGVRRSMISIGLTEDDVEDRELRWSIIDLGWKIHVFLNEIIKYLNQIISKNRP